MPKPARYVNDVVRGPYRSFWKHSGGGGNYWASGSAECLLSRTYVDIPATVVNVKREDGSYPVSAYHMHRLVVKTSGKPLHNVEKIDYYETGYWGWYTSDSTASPEFPSDLMVPSGKDAAEFILPGVIMTTNVDARARVKFLSKLADASGKDQVQLGAALGEIRETIGMTADLAQGITSGVRSIARNLSQAPTTVARALDSLRRYGKKETASRVLHGDVRLLERIVEGWLVVQFGIKPLLHDIYDGTVWAQAAATKGENPLRVHIRGGAEDTATDVELLHTQNNVNAATYWLAGLYAQSVKVSYACDYYIPTNPSVTQQLGLYNPISVGWEVARFSWMVDYVVDIGGWLRSMMAADQCSFLEGTKSVVRRSGLTDVIDVTSRYDSVLRLPMKPGKPLVSADFFDRTVLAHGVMPPLLPGMKSKLNLHRLANSLAALTTLVGARQSGGPWHLRP